MEDGAELASAGMRSVSFIRNGHQKPKGAIPCRMEGIPDRLNHPSTRTMYQPDASASCIFTASLHHCEMICRK
ncbi:Fumarylacetoacetate hydrolase family protein [Granulibacter bethesdensis]|nr:Fumarylacetoacetate hydrolase family protein [Granulibacter bethesdensis]